MYLTEPTVIHIVLHFCCNILQRSSSAMANKYMCEACVVLVANIALPPVFSVNNLKFR